MEDVQEPLRNTHLQDVDQEKCSHNADSASSFERLSTELLLNIFCEVTDVETLMNLSLTCSAFSRVYKQHQRHILVVLSEKVYAADDVNFSLPTLVSKAWRIDVNASSHRERVTELLKQYPEGETLSQEQVSEIDTEQCKQMLRSHSCAQKICASFASRMLFKRPFLQMSNTKEAPLSTPEISRMMKSIYRWELWSALFSQHTIDRKGQNQLAIIDDDTQESLFLSRYTIWEAEQMSCLTMFIREQYDMMVEEGREWWYSGDVKTRAGRMKRAFATPCWNSGYGECLPSFLVVISLTFSCEQEFPKIDQQLNTFINRGPQTFCRVQHNRDLETRTFMLVELNVNYWPYFQHVVHDQGHYSPDFHDRLPIREPLEDAPFGYRWARTTLQSRDYDAPWEKGWCPSENRPGFYSPLWEWGYAFWDETRLREWGLELDGKVLLDKIKDDFEKQGTPDRDDNGLKIMKMLGVGAGPRNSEEWYFPSYPDDSE